MEGQSSLIPAIMSVLNKPKEKPTEQPMIFYSHYCYDCTGCFVSRDRIKAKCWYCKSENTTSGVDEKYKPKEQEVKMNEPEQCECCLDYSTGNFYVVCQTCVDKAARLDITQRDKRFLFKAVESSLANVDRILNENDLESNTVLQLLAEIRARLYVVGWIAGLNQ